VDPHELSAAESTVYRTVTCAYLASLLGPASVQKGTASIAIGSATFSASYQSVTDPGFTRVPGYEYRPRGVGATALEGLSLAVGQPVPVVSVVLKEAATKPPAALTESDLIELMDKTGIGTDATIAQHIDMVLKRKYAQRSGRAIVPTTFGTALVRGFSSMGPRGAALLLPELRARTELDVRAVANGNLDGVTALSRAIETWRELFASVRESAACLEGAVAGAYPGSAASQVVPAIGPGPPVGPAALPGAGSCPQCGGRADALRHADGYWRVVCRDCPLGFRLNVLAALELLPCDAGLCGSCGSKLFLSSDSRVCPACHGQRLRGSHPG
jgi:DNA topoisomerase-3